MNVLYNKLEFDKIIRQVSTFALSVGGENALLQSEHFTEPDKVKKSLDLLSELLSIYRNPTKEFKVSRFYDVKTHILRTTKSDVLSPAELYEVGATVSQYFAIGEFIANPDGDSEYPLLDELFSITKLAKPFYTDVMRYIDEEGNISSKASPELARIRRELGSIDGKIMKQANEVLQRYGAKNALMTDSVTIRDGLPCIGVKPTFKNSVGGMIVDSSATGQTIFIVPSEVLAIYNESKLLRDEEIAEINRILKKYCMDIADQSEVLLLVNREMTQFDVINAKAKYTIASDYNVPDITDNGYIELINAKNPFLAGKVVPLNIHIGDEFNTLIITGPNTGGKTVALKTTGLCVLMACWGVGIPADDHSRISVFENVFADIGDDQSIASSLSTFSSHIKNIKNILQVVDESYRPNAERIKPSSLVLIDELGTGTDPAEGEALAISIIRHLRDKNAVSIVTSHFNGLKYFATQEPNIMNAAMDFDAQHGSPTFKLKIGIPGSSKAIEISQRLGLSQDIIDDAKSIISHGFFEIDKIIENLNIQQRQLDAALDENEKLKNKMENKLAECSVKIAKAREKETQLNQLINNQKKDFIRKARREFEQIIKQIKDSNADKQSIKAGLAFADKIDSQIEQTEKLIEKKHYTETESVTNCVGTELNNGDSVLIISKNIKGTVIGRANGTKNGIACYTIQAGIIKIKVSADDLHKTETPKPTAPVVKKVSFVPDSQIMSLDIRGLRCDEAERKLDEFIDSSMLNNYGEVRIIHGMGTGALRDFVVSYLKTNSLVVDFGYEKDAGGGLNYGVTEVKLR